MSNKNKTLTDRVRDRILSMDDEIRFSIQDFRDIPTNISHTLSTLSKQGEIFLIEQKKVEGIKRPINFYSKTSLLGKKVTKQGIDFACLGWEKVYPEFFTIPEFHERGIIVRSIEL